MTQNTQACRKASYDPYSGPGCPLSAGGPSPMNLIYATSDTVQAAYALHHAHKIGDGEGKRDAAIRVIAGPATIIQAASAATVLVAEHILVCGGWLLPLLAVVAPPLLIIGLAICLLELIYEGNCRKRAMGLLDNLHVTQIERLTSILSIQDEKKRAQAIGDWIRDNPLDPKKWAEQLRALNQARHDGVLLADVEPILAGIRDRLVRDDLDYLYTKYYTLNEKDHEKIDSIFRRNGTKPREQLEAELLAVKRAKLARRIMPWCADQVQANVATMIQRINTTVGAARAHESKEATKLLTLVAIQAKKKLIIHTLAIIAIGLTFLALLKFAPFTLLLLACIIITLAYMYGQGTLNEKSWGFSIKKALLPNCVINWLENRKKKVDAAPPIQPARVAVI